MSGWDRRWRLHIRWVAKGMAQAFAQFNRYGMGETQVMGPPSKAAPVILIDHYAILMVIDLLLPIT